MTKKPNQKELQNAQILLSLPGVHTAIQRICFSSCYSAYALEVLNLNTYIASQKYFPLKAQASKAGVYGAYLKI